MPEKNPPCSIIIPTLNRPDETLHAAESVAGQLRTGDELIVVDDGSVAAAWEALSHSLREFQSVALVRNPGPHGAQNARQHGLSFANGLFIGMLDSDDIWLPGKLDAQREFLLKRPNYIAVVTGHEWRDRSGNDAAIRRSWGDVMPYPVTVVNNMSSPLIRREALEKAGGFSTDGSDFGTVDNIEFHLRLRRQGPVGAIPDVLVTCFQHSGGRMSDALPNEQSLQDFVNLIAHHQEYLASDRVNRRQILYAGSRRAGAQGNLQYLRRMLQACQDCYAHGSMPVGERAHVWAQWLRGLASRQSRHLTRNSM
jgi:glycosyltransferase involved in cell wall biosynthesis